MQHRSIVVVTSLLLMLLLAFAGAGLSPFDARAAGAAGTIAYAPADTLDEIRLIEPDGSGDRRLWAHGQPDALGVYEISNLEWSPDSRQVAFVSDHENWCSLHDSDVYTVGVQGGAARRITQAPACAELAGMPKGTVRVPVSNGGFDSFVGFVYYQGAPSAQQVTLPPGGATVLTFDDVADFGPGVLQAAVFIQGAQRYLGGATASDVQPGGTVETNTLSVFGLSEYYVWFAHSVTWKSDGSTLGFFFNYDSMRQISLTPEPLDIGTPLQNDQSQMPDFADLLAWGPPGRADQLLYAGNSAYASEAIYLVSAGSATAGQALVSGESYQQIRGLAWLPDGSGFVYSQAEEYGDTYANVFVYRFATGKSERLTSFTNEFAGQVSVSPDGQTVVFERSPQRDKLDGTALWTVGVDGSGLKLFKQNAARPGWSHGALPPPLTPRAFLPFV
ncbi:MAG TPA: hypothetical protein VFT99_24190, partial [Roseiflexaceae bacterium]|nr:hypothetical protein [Roseiflexaceae bacterium]